jgi:hypothetical protein
LREEWAAACRADLLVTTDDRFIRRCIRSTTATRVIDPIEALAEVSR